MLFIYKKIANLGIYPAMSLDKVKQIRLLNIYILTWLHLAIYYIIHDYFLNPDFIHTFYIHVVTMVVSTVAFYFNFFKKYFAAKILWISYFMLNISYFSMCLEPGHFIEYFMFLVGGIALSLFKKNTIAYIALACSVFLFLVPYYFIPIYSVDIINRIQVGSTIGCMICVFLQLLYFKNQNLKNETLLSLEKDKVLSDKIILQVQQKELKELSDFKSTFFVNFSHEIRTPLTLIQGYREQLIFEKTEEENNRFLTVIDGQLNEIRTITDNIIDLSKLDENKIVLNKAPHSVNSFLNKIYGDFKALFEQKNIDFKLHELSEDASISFDFNLMNRSFGNILNNALKFTPRNGQVLLMAKATNKEIFINIKDTGIGIAKNDLPLIFNRFYQVDNDITKSKGSGIGLTFTKNILNVHGFEIKIKSEVDKGTLIRVFIPQEFINISTQATSVTKIIPIVSKKTILLVDDHLQMRNYLKGILENYNVIEAENGKDALEIIKTTVIDLLLTDYMMPMMDGWELIKNIKKLNYIFPVFVLTARVDIEGRLKMLRLGIDNYFTKPFLKEELLPSIDRALNYHETIKTEQMYDHDRKEIIDTKRTDHFKKNIIETLNNHISDSNFGVEDLADILKTSSKTLTRKTKIYFGQTPNQLIMEFRLQKANNILENTPQILIKDLAKMVGLKNGSYLKKRFEKRFQN